MRHLLLASFCLCLTAPLYAQGLIWKLPEDGTFIRYEGTYTQLARRPDAADGDLTLVWRRNITLKSVGSEEAEFQGTTQTCRWVEIKVETGVSSEGILEAGPGGIRMYKLLIPESTIRGTVNEPLEKGREMFVSHIQIVKGYRKIGDEPAAEIQSGVFQLYPMVTLLRHFRELVVAPASEETNVPAGNFTGTLNSGKMSAETTTERSTTTADFYRADNIPFGVVKWTAKMLKERKGSVDPRSEFKESVVITEELQAIEIGQGAESEFLVN